MSDNKKSIFPLILFLLFLLLVGVFGYNFLKNLSAGSETSSVSSVMDDAGESAANLVGMGENADDTIGLDDAEDGLQSLIDGDVPSYGNAITTVNTPDLLRERSIGDENAPLKIVEHSSLTCVHCGSFHKNAYKQIKENYIDTGKVHLTFSDFPLNGPAVTAAMVARCVPESRYFDFVQFLFERQDDWAYKANYESYLKQNAQLTGLNGESFDNCVSNEELKTGILNKMKMVQDSGSVRSTPTFVVNGETVLSGAHPYEYFAKIFDAELAKINLAQ